MIRRVKPLVDEKLPVISYSFNKKHLAMANVEM